MAFTDYGLGLGLAYRHDYQSADQFKLAATEMGQREKERLFREREAGLNREERVRERRASSNKLISDYTQEAEVQGSFWQNKYREELEPKLKEIAEFSSDPNWEQDIENWNTLNRTKAWIQNHPIVKKQMEAKAQYELAKSEYEKGLIDPQEFSNETEAWGKYLTKGEEYSYNSKQFALENRFEDFFGSYKVSEGYFESPEEQAMANEFYSKNTGLVEREYRALSKPEQELFGTPKNYVLLKSRLYTGAEKVKDAADKKDKDGSSTEAERRWAAAYGHYKEKFMNPDIEDGEEITDEEVKNLVPVNSDGAYNKSKVVYFSQGGETIEMKVIRTPDNGLFPIDQLSSKWKRYNGNNYIETTFRVPLDPSKEVKAETETEGVGPFGLFGEREKKTGNYIVANEAYKQFKELGMITQENLKIDEPYYVVKAWSLFNPGRKEILKYYDESYGEDQGAFTVGGYDETPTGE